jgi:hypothetical protein
MACKLYIVQNTGTTDTTISYESCESGETCIGSFIVGSGETYYVNAVSTGTPFSGTGFTFSSTITAVDEFYFSAACDGTTFYLLSDSGDTTFQSGYTYCFEDVVSCVSPTKLSGCFTVVSINGGLGYPQYSAVLSPSYSGTSVTACTGTCACTLACDTDYCITGTDTAFDDNYKYIGDYDGYPSFEGLNNGYFIFYSSGETSWCLSSSLGGTCDLFGKSPCISNCPDLCTDYFNNGICPTPTPSPTTNCNVLDFNAIFDCAVTPTPSVTPTISVTPTVSVTPSATNYCSVLGVDASISGFTPTPTMTPTATPTPTPDVTRPCNVTGNVSFSIVDGNIKCPTSSQFQDCLNGQMYYTINTLVMPSGGTISQYMIFKANVDGVSRCLSYVGTNGQWIGTNDIELVEGPIGYSNLGDCVLCTPDITQTPTQTPTPTPTPTTTPTPTPSPMVGYFTYLACKTGQYVVQTQMVPGVIVNSVFFNTDDKLCWEYLGYSPTYPQLPVPLPVGSIPNYTGNYFVNIGTTVYDLCRDCIASTHT